ncbi:putative pritein [Desulfonema limicola]|uniref:Pritein n=1 Tax=Desulfonema limicola TaxID=45656 RepID=A0A975B962_9BACT|nr:hypothetical protein [Desulfonema limicola]QTA80976.1 putative pritein [Desulfonema limicola]
MSCKKYEFQKHLRVFEDRSEYFTDDDNVEMFAEGVISVKAKKRIKKVRHAFENGFLDKLIINLSNGKENVDVTKISKAALNCVNELVDSLTSEVGRALIGLSVMQLCVKSIEPNQNIRLHKGSSNRASFSWVEGISMRTLDKKYVTPTLRKYNLLRLNADGFMMTRSLAENYPYTFLYKAYLRGAREQWLTLVEEIEKQKTSVVETLKYLLSRLINAASEFVNTANELLNEAQKYVSVDFDKQSISFILKQHSEKSDYAARLLEINMHSLMQAASESGAFGGAEVKPLSQMRSANKKHGNIGDIELLEDGQIIESWDAKYGKGYLREEIEEAIEKIKHHDFVDTVGFVTNVHIERTEEISKRISELEQLYSISLKVISYDDWIDMVFQRAIEVGTVTEDELAQKWFMTYCEYLSQKRRQNAPIDEPCLSWVTSLTNIIKNV